MSKNKIAFKLSSYFAIALLVFSIIIGSIFVVLFKKHTVELHKDGLANRANSIATTLSGYMEQGNKMSSYNTYMKFIGDIAGTDVWIVDEDLNLIIGGMHNEMMNDTSRHMMNSMDDHMMNSINNHMVDADYKYSDLPPNADTLIKEVFNDKTVFSEDFSNVLSELTLTIGTPIKNSNNNVIGVVLLHSPVKGINSAVSQGFTVLSISILVALIIAFLLSIGFSITFTKPLRKMKNTAIKLSLGDYTAKNNITQNDDIGELASTIDILANRLDISSKQSDRLDKMRKDFIANISHELKTPVTVIRGSLEALVDKIVKDPIKIEQYHKQMLNETLFLQRLVTDLLDLSKLQNPDFIISKEKISLCDVIDDATRSASHLVKNKDIKIKLHKDNEISIIEGDYGRLRQMLMIILDNAIKFSPENSTVEVTLKKKTISIQDFGIGIPTEDLPHIFDRFYKSRSEENKTGTGLGLAIAKQIADRHDIKLNIKSDYGNGSTFIFKFN